MSDDDKTITLSGEECDDLRTLIVGINDLGQVLITTSSTLLALYIKITKDER